MGRVSLCYSIEREKFSLIVEMMDQKCSIRQHGKIVDQPRTCAGYAYVRKDNLIDVGC